MAETAPARKRVLFVAEAVTLAHVARPAALAAALDERRYETIFATDPQVRRFVTVPDERFAALSSLPAARFAARLQRGMPVYEASELEAHVAADRALLARVRPDIVVGDFRLSLGISARLESCPYAAIANAYWSPWAADRTLPLPVLPWTPFVPLAVAQRAFSLFETPLLARHCRPLNRVRAGHRLPPLPADLRQIYTDADDTLYADSPHLFPTPGAPAHHRHIGPVLWSPPVPVPAWWSEARGARPLVYVTMGSSGRGELLGRIFQALAGLAVDVIAASAGAVPAASGPGIRVADYLPGEEAARRASLVICNGGSPTSQQALAARKPVLGLCANMDQMLNMRGLEAAGLGTARRTDRLSVRELRAAVRGLLERDPATADATFAGATQPDSKLAFTRFIESRIG